MVINEKGDIMKQFEKWWRRNWYSNGTSHEKRATGKVWRAALEWALSQETIKPLLGYNEHRYIDSIVIRNELNNG